MSAKEILASFVFLLIIFEAYSKMCNRPCGCLNGGVFDASKNTCVSCSGNYGGFDCGLRSQAATNKCTPDHCKGPASVCYGDGKCYCDGLRGGDRCQYEKEKVTCDRDTIKISILMDRKKRGEKRPMVFIQTKGRNMLNEECELERRKLNRRWDMYEIKLNLHQQNSPGCEGALKTTESGNQFNYTATVYVRPDLDTYSPYDWTVDFTCSATSLGTSKVLDATAENNRIEFGIADVNKTKILYQIADNPFNLYFYSPDGYIKVNKLEMRDEYTGQKLVTLIREGKLLFGGKLLSEKGAGIGGDGVEYATFENGKLAAFISQKKPGSYFPKNVYYTWSAKVCKHMYCDASREIHPSYLPKTVLPNTPNAQIQGQPNSEIVQGGSLPGQNQVNTMSQGTVQSDPLLGQNQGNTPNQVTSQSTQSWGQNQGNAMNQGAAQPSASPGQNQVNTANQGALQTSLLPAQNQANTATQGAVQPSLLPGQSQVNSANQGIVQPSLLPGQSPLNTINQAVVEPSVLPGQSPVNAQQPQGSVAANSFPNAPQTQQQPQNQQSSQSQFQLNSQPSPHTPSGQQTGHQTNFPNQPANQGGVQQFQQQWQPPINPNSGWQHGQNTAASSGSAQPPQSQQQPINAPTSGQAQFSASGQPQTNQASFSPLNAQQTNQQPSTWGV